MTILKHDILLIEDDACDVELTLREFESHDFHDRIMVLRDGVEALKFLHGEPNGPGTDNLPRAILIGWKLPRVDGIGLLYRIKGHARTRRIPSFLMISASQDIEHLAKERVQPDGYLVKPVGFQDFARQFGPATVRQFHGNQVTFDATAHERSCKVV